MLLSTESPRILPDELANQLLIPSKINPATVHAGTVQNADCFYAGCDMDAPDRVESMCPILIAFVSVMCLGIAGPLASAQGSGPGRWSQLVQPGTWQPHHVTFQYLGLDSAYSCDALKERLTFLLRQSGARLESVSVGPCFHGYGPQELAYAQLKFSTLRPATAIAAPPRGSPLAGRWRSVQFSPQQSGRLLGGQDCQLVQEFRLQLLSLFTTREVQASFPCVPIREDTPYKLRFDVFVLKRVPSSQR